MISLAFSNCLFEYSQVQQGTISRHLARNAALTIIVNNLNVLHFMCLKVIIVPTRIQGSNFYVMIINIYS